MLLYFEGAISDDVETQRKGLALCIVWNPKNKLPKKPTVEEHRAHEDIKKGIPYRWSALHICLPESPFSNILKAFLLVAYGQDTRVRARIHPGMSMETQYKLMTFGLNMLDFPLTSTGSIKNKYHFQWIKTRQAIDECRRLGISFQGVCFPGVNDVLFRTGGVKNHHGNMEFKAVIEALLCKERYRNMYATKKDRRQLDDEQHETRVAIRAEIILQIKARNGRFLAMDEGGWWKELSPNAQELHDKIASSIYDHQKRLQAASRLKRTNCDTASFLNSSKKSRLADDDSCGGSCNFCSL